MAVEGLQFVKVVEKTFGKAKKTPRGRFFVHR
jgi:hypothetical protein